MNETTKKRGQKIRDEIVIKIIEYIEEHGYPPTNREICQMTGLKSTSSVSHYLSVLFAEGRLETDAPECAPRAIRVPGYKFTKVAG